MDTSRNTTAVLAALSLSTLLSSLGTSSANVALPALAAAFDASFQQVQWVVLAYLVAMTTLIVGIGRLGDLLGRRRLLVAGLALFSLASALCALAPTLPLLIAARAAQGIGAAAMMALAMALVGETMPKAKTGSAMGLLGTMSAIGTALGPSLGGVLLSAFGWQAIFLLNVPLGLVALFLVRRSLPAVQPARSAAPFDAAGMLVLAVTLAVYSMAMTFSVGLVFVAFIGAAMFIRTEARAASPLVRLAMFRNPVLSAGFAMSALVTTVVMATLVVGPFYLSGALGAGPAMVGAVMSIGPIVAALAGVPSGRLVDRFGPQAATLTGLAAMAAGSATLAVTSGLWTYIPALVIITAGYALFQAANNTAVTTSSAPGERGVVAGLLSLSRNLGLITGASAMGAVFALAQDPEQGLHLTFAVAAILMAAGLAIALGWSNQARDTQNAARR